MHRIILFILLLATLSGSAQNVSREAAREFNKRLGRGINFMAVKINQGYHDPFDFNLIRENKFTHVRIGSRVWQYVSEAPDFTIDPEKLASYKDAVDWALDHDLMVVMDPIHYWKEYSNADLPMLIKLWEQFAETFADYPIDKVAFEIFNEPWSYDFDLEAILEGCIGVIRETPGNEERIVIVSGQAFSTRKALIDAFKNNVVFPTDDPYLIGTFHYYDPRDFTNQGEAGNIYWADGGDSDPEWDETIDKFQEVVDANNQWAVINGTEPLPIYNGEYGVDNGAPSEDRIRWLWWVRMVSEQMGFSNSLWTLYNNSADSKGLGPWTDLQKNDPTTRYLDQYVLVPYRNRYEAEEGILSGSFSPEAWGGSSDDSVASTNNGIPGDDIILEEVYIAKSGTYDVTFRYQHNDTGELILAVASGTETNLTDPVNLIIPPSEGQWKSVTVPLEFSKGEDNRISIKLESNTVSFRLDYVAVTKGHFYDNLFPSEETDALYVGIDEKKDSGMNIYPNPANDKVCIDGEFRKWDLYSSNGINLLSGSTTTLSVDHLEPGFYFLVVNDVPYKLLVR